MVGQVVELTTRRMGHILAWACLGEAAHAAIAKVHRAILLGCLLSGCFTEPEPRTVADTSTTGGTQVSSSAATTAGSMGDTSGAIALSTGGDDTTSSSETTGGGDACAPVGPTACEDGLPVLGERCWLDAPVVHSFVVRELGEGIVVDVTADGYADVLVTQLQPDTRGSSIVAWILQGSPNGIGVPSPLTQTDTQGHDSAQTIDAANLDDDAELEVLVGGTRDGVGVAYAFDWGAEGFTLIHGFALGPSPRVTARFADIAGPGEVPSWGADGRIDVVLAPIDVVGEVITFPSNLDVGAYNFGPELYGNLGGAVGFDIRFVPTAGHSYAALVGVNPDGTVFWGIPAPGGAWNLNLPVNGTLEQPQVAAGQLDVDDQPEILVTGRAGTDSHVAMFDLVAEDALAELGSLALGPGESVTAAIGDVDRDGDGDIAVAGNGDDRVTVYWSASLNQPTVFDGAASRPRRTGIGDIDGDCVPDVVAFGSTDIAVWFSVP